MTRPERAYLILTLERTGSGLLCDALERTGRLGTPYELFGADMHRRATELGLAAADSTPESPRPTALADYVDAVARQTSSGGVFGSKLHRYQYLQLERDGLAASPLDLVPHDCRSTARLVLLTREDRQRQAISILLARATGAYGVVDDEDAPQMKLPGNPHWASRLEASPEVVRATLDEILETIVEHERGWRGWLERSGVDVLEISYEALCGDYADAVARVARYVAAVELRPGEVPGARLRRQRDEVTESLLRLWGAAPARRPA